MLWALGMLSARVSKIELIPAFVHLFPCVHCGEGKYRKAVFTSQLWDLLDARLRCVAQENDVLGSLICYWYIGYCIVDKGRT